MGVTIGWQVVYFLSGSYCLVKILFKICRGAGVGDSGKSGFLMYGGLVSHPYDMVDCKLVAEYDFATVVYVYDGIESGVRLPEEIEERGILTERIGVVFIVDTAFVIAEKQNKSGSCSVAESFSSPDINFFIEHNIFLLKKRNRFEAKFSVTPISFIVER